MNRMTIGECCEVLDNFRKPINAEERATMVGHIPYYGANGIQGYIDKYILDEDLILIAEDGGNFEDYQNRPIAYKITGKSWVNNHAHILKARVGFDQDFIYYSIVNKNILHYIKGGTRSKLNKSELVEIPILIPVLDTQRKIAHILSTVDRQIEKTEQLIRKYEMVKEGMMQDLFTRGIDVKTGKLRPSYEEAPGIYKESELGWIPKEWEVILSIEFCSSIADGTHDTPKPVQFGIPLITSKNLRPNGTLDLDNVYNISITDFEEIIKRSFVVRYDVLYGLIGTIGNPVLISMEQPMFATKNVGIFRFDGDEFKANYFILFLQSKFAEIQIDKILSGSSQKFLSLSNIRNFTLPVMSNAELKAFCLIVNGCTNKIEREYNSLTKLYLLKTALMQDLLTGKLDLLD